MERNIQKNGGINVLLFLVVSVATFAVSRYSQSLAAQIAAVFLGFALLVSMVSWFQMRLEDRERVEKWEFDELTKGQANRSALFQAPEAEAFPARRAREQFEKYFTPGFTVLLLLLQGGGAWWFWRWLGKASTPPTLAQPLGAMGILGLFALVLFLLGQFNSRLARLENHRLLRPGASQLLFGAYLLAAVVAAIAGVQSGFPLLDTFLARVFCCLMALLAAETLLTLLLEVYRPRVKGK